MGMRLGFYLGSFPGSHVGEPKNEAGILLCHFPPRSQYFSYMYLYEHIKTVVLQFKVFVNVG